MSRRRWQTWRTNNSSEPESTVCSDLTTTGLKSFCSSASFFFCSSLRFFSANRSSSNLLALGSPPLFTCFSTCAMNFCVLAPFLFFKPKVLSCKERGGDINLENHVLRTTTLYKPLAITQSNSSKNSVITPRFYRPHLDDLLLLLLLCLLARLLRGLLRRHGGNSGRLDQKERSVRLSFATVPNYLINCLMKLLPPDTRIVERSSKRLFSQAPTPGPDSRSGWGRIQKGWPYLASSITSEKSRYGLFSRWQEWRWGQCFTFPTSSAPDYLDLTVFLIIPSRFRPLCFSALQA